MVVALAARKATFLASPEWTSIPWKGCEKYPFETITDILLQFPGVLEEYDVIVTQARSPEMIDQASELRQKCWGFHDLLLHWYEKVVAQSLEQPEPDGPGWTPQKDLADVLEKQDIALLCPVALYCSACILLYDTMKGLFGLYPPDDPLELELLASRRLDPKHYALCILSIVPYFLPKEGGVVTALAIAFPLGCVGHYMYRPAIAAAGEAIVDDDDELGNLLRQMNDMTDGAPWFGSFVKDLRSCATMMKGRLELDTEPDEHSVSNCSNIHIKS